MLMIFKKLNDKDNDFLTRHEEQSLLFYANRSSQQSQECQSCSFVFQTSTWQKKKESFKQVFPLNALCNKNTWEMLCGPLAKNIPHCDTNNSISQSLLSCTSRIKLHAKFTMLFCHANARNHNVTRPATHNKQNSYKYQSKNRSSLTIVEDFPG